MRFTTITSMLLCAAALSSQASAGNDTVMVPIEARAPSKAFDDSKSNYGIHEPVASNGYLLRVLANGPRLQVEIASATAGRTTVDIEGVAVQVANMWVHGNRLVVQSWTHPSLSAQIDIFDIQTGERVDSFWGWSPSASPDGRHIAFVKFYPVHFVSGTESQYRIYDVEGSPEQNRPSYSKRQTRSPGDSESVSRVGVAMFPLSAEEIDRPNVEIPAKQAHHMRSEFAWSNRGEVAFIDSIGGKNQLIVVDTSTLQPGNVRAFSAPVEALDDACRDKAKRDCAHIDSNRLSVLFSGSTSYISIAGLNGAPTKRLGVDAQRLKRLDQARFGQFSE